MSVFGTWKRVFSSLLIVGTVSHHNRSQKHNEIVAGYTNSPVGRVGAVQLALSVLDVLAVEDMVYSKQENIE